MKVDIIDNNNITVFLSKFYTNNLNLNDRNNLEIYFKDLFLKLKNIYKLTIIGYYNINVFLDDIYGLIVSIKKEEQEYFDYFPNQVDMRITIDKSSNIIYNIKDYYEIPNEILKKCNIYKYKNNIYVYPYEMIDNISMGKIIESSNIIYGDIVLGIINEGQIINI
jgi:hypothetical protein